ncbi:Serine/threonine kinase [Apophysomyces sp. BC1034]|nr:Serine/threonine kinase [Apophysomyces sp. BC1034]
MEDNTSKIQELETKLEQNTQLRDKAIELRRMLEDRNAQLQCDTQVKEFQRYVDYFSEELGKLRRRTSSKPTTLSMNSQFAAYQNSEAVETLIGESGTCVQSPTLYSPVSLSFVSDLTSPQPQDLLKAHTPINRAKVSLKLHELEYKVDVEKKVQVGIRNLVHTLEPNGSNAAERKRKLEIQEKQSESDEKMTLLTNAVRKYKNLYIGEDEEEDEEQLGQPEVEDVRPVRLHPGARRPVSGKLQLNVLEAQELAHAPTRMFRVPQTVAMVKIDGNIQCRTRPSRQDKWSDAFEMHVDKATEVELLIYDQSGDKKLPIGLLWLKISDIAESLRKQKLIQERHDTNWVPADVAQQEQPVVPSSHGEQVSPKNGQKNSTGSTEGIQAWFDVEPVGRVLLNINFVRENVKRRPMDKLGRADAVRERKGEIHEMNGHQFVVRRFYHIMRCALCGDFMVNLTFQCQECGVTCHTKCAHLVPYFCGMSMEKANLMLSEMKAASRRKTTQLDGLPQFSLAGQLEGRLSISSQYSQSSGPSPQASLSTPTSSRTGQSQTRPLSLTLETPIYQSMTAPFTESSESSRKTSILHSSTLFKKKTLVQVTRKVGLDDFNFLAVLGKGNFGKVMLAEEKYTSNLYAIKILKKRFVLDNDEIESTRSEKRVFLTANREQHPFLINLHSAFQTETRVYFVMEYVSGGDLMMHIQREPFSEKRARFYACEVLLALEYFHKHGIIYRDLKLDNIMLCMDGHIKIADYGLCKENIWFNSTTNTFCGTPEFMAPEILLDHRYGRAVDWWAFGVLLYEMLLGQSPFKGEDEDEIFEAVLEDEILYPINMSRNSVSVCQKLLQREPSRRLGSGKGDGQDVRAHSFFAGVNWEDMMAKKVTPPFLPTVNGRADTSNFDEEFTREIPILTPVNAMLTPLEQQEFTAFSYVADWAMDGSSSNH